MAVSRLLVRNYRSLVNVSLPLADVTVIRGPNASGKTNLYRALLVVEPPSRGWAILGPWSKRSNATGISSWPGVPRRDCATVDLQPVGRQMLAAADTVAGA